MTTPHRIWTFVGIVGAVSGMVELARQHQKKEDPEPMPTPEDDLPTLPPAPLDLREPRDQIVAWAESQEGESDPQRYWLSAIGRPASDPETDWCGAFVLTALHRQGIALNRKWALGKGLEATLPELEKTKNPERGDIAYFTQSQHVAIVAEVTGNTVRLVNGNGAGGRVTITNRPLKDAKAYYSIAQYLRETPNEPLTVAVEP